MAKKAKEADKPQDGKTQEVEAAKPAKAAPPTRLLVLSTYDGDNVHIERSDFSALEIRAIGTLLAQFTLATATPVAEAPASKS